MCMGACTLKHFEKVNKACDLVRKGCGCIMFEFYSLRSRVSVILKNLFLRNIESSVLFFWILGFCLGRFVLTDICCWKFSFFEIVFVLNVMYMWACNLKHCRNRIRLETLLRNSSGCFISDVLSIFVFFSHSSLCFWGILNFPWTVSASWQNFLGFLNLLFFANQFLCFYEIFFDVKVMYMWVLNWNTF